MKVKIHGSRGSFPVSPQPSRIEEILKNAYDFFSSNSFSSWKDARTALQSKDHSFCQSYGGHTSCIEIQGDNKKSGIFIDAGTGLSEAWRDNDSLLSDRAFQVGQGKTSFLVTHTHWDHIIALPTFAPLFIPGNEFHFYSPLKDIETRIAGLFNPSYFPATFETVKPQMLFKVINPDKSFKIGAFKIDAQLQRHPGGSYAYRIQEGKKKFVFASDIELRPEMIEADEDSIYWQADCLMIDSHYFPEDFREGFGHSHVNQVVDFSVNHEVKKLYLFHQNPEYTDSQIELQLKRALNYKSSKYGSHKLDIQMSAQGHHFSL